MEPKEHFGRNLRRHRTEAGLTQEQLAWKLHLSATEISKFELGKRDPQLSTIVRLAGALDLTAADLVQGIPKPPRPR